MGVIQGSINNLLTTAGVAARLSPRLEEKRYNIATAKEEQRLEKAYTDLTEHTLTPAGISQQEAAELESEAATKILTDLENVQMERAKSGQGSFAKVLETKFAKSAYDEDISGGTKPQAEQSYEDKINKRINAMKQAEQDMFIKQEESRNGRLRR